MSESCGQIYSLLPKIIGEISPIAKARKNQQQGYNFRGVDDVYEALNGLLSKHGVTIVPRLVEQEESHWDNTKGNKVFRVKTTFDYDIFGPDGSHVTSRIPSEAMDTGDKATPKALSMAFKYMAFQVFCIPIDEKLDTENNTHEITGRYSAPSPASKPAATRAPRADARSAAAPPADSDLVAQAKRLYWGCNTFEDLEKIHKRAMDSDKFTDAEKRNLTVEYKNRADKLEEEVARL